MMFAFNGASKKLQTCQAAFRFSRYFNRAQVQDQTYKTDMTAYQYKPQLIYKIDPAAYYPDEPNLSAGKQLARDKFRDSLERFRDNALTKRRQRDRFLTGRLFAHLRNEELKKAVQLIKDKETGADEREGAAARALQERGVWMEQLEVDDQFKLPYGVGFDKLIKKRTDMVDRDKLQNNRVMDELVAKLGYMDYRDALACNKYLLEVKRHGDYHQQAHAKILAVALSRYNAQRRQQIDQKALAKGSADRDEAII